MANDIVTPTTAFNFASKLKAYIHKRKTEGPVASITPYMADIKREYAREQRRIREQGIIKR